MPTGRAPAKRWLVGGTTRVAVVASMVMAVAASSLVVELATEGAAVEAVDGWFALGILGLSILMLGATARRELSRRRWAQVGFLYMAALAMTVALRRAVDPSIMTRGGWSTCAILVLVYPVAFPVSPRGALAFGAFALAAEVGLAAALGSLPAGPGDILALQFGVVAATGLAASLAFLTRRVGAEEVSEDRFGAYTLHDQIGKGGMGEVFRAHHEVLDRAAAVKLIKTGRGRDDASRRSMIARFTREAWAMARLRSPHAVRIFDYGVRADGELWYAMELLDGVDMVTLVQRSHPIPVERVIHLVVQACAALEEAHERGLVHRDVKPTNVMVCRMGTEVDFVKVLDFGLVKALGARGGDFESGERPAAAGALTRDGSSPGTPGFMAPEQILDPMTVDARTDVYALGCLLYFLLTSRPVFEAPGPEAAGTAHIALEPTPPSARSQRSLSPELDALVLKCLEKKPADRWQSARALALALEALPEARGWTRARAEAEWRDQPRASVAEWALASTKET